MAASILRTFLRLNLFELSGDDSRLKKLEAAAADLGDSFARAPSTALPVLMAALQPTVAADALAAVAEVIETHWSTYLGAFRGGSATTLYRAVVLQALFDAIDAQPPLGVAISLLLRNFGPLLELGKTADAVTQLMVKADEAFANEGKASSAPQVAELKAVVAEAVKAGSFDKANIQKRVDAAVGPANRNGQAGESPNPHWPNTGQPWSYEFSDRFTALFGDFLNGALTSAAKMDAENFKALSSALNAALARIDSKARRSTSLLWWRQALFSESADKPYRELEATDLVVHAALDLGALVPDAYERALESFLTEAVLSLLPAKQELTAVDVAKACVKLASAVQAATGGGQVPSGLVLSGALENGGALYSKRLKQTAQQWAAWLLREVKATAAVSSPRAVPPRKAVAAPASAATAAPAAPNAATEGTDAQGGDL